MATYSFLETAAAMTGPGGAVNLAAGAAVSEEGITIEPADNINTMTIGADGTPMHSLHANKGGTIMIRLLKTSPVNQLLMNMYNYQTASSAAHGQNTITLANTHTGDTVTCQFVAFKKAPSLTYAKEGGTNEWQLDCGKIDRTLGAGA